MKKSFVFSALALVSSALALSSCGNAQEDVIRIGMECNYAPFNWSLNQENEFSLPIANLAAKHADGYDVQIAKRIASYSGRKVEIVATTWEALVPDLQSGDLDLIVAGMSDTEERRRSISFSDEYYRSELVLIASKEIADAYEGPLGEEEFSALVSGKHLVSQSGTITYSVIADEFSKFGAIQDTAVSTFQIAAEDVKSGVSFAMTAELPVAESIAANYPTLGIIHINQDILGESKSELGVSIGLRKGDAFLLKMVNDVLSTISSEERISLMAGAVERSSDSK
ncbi:MAG: transporter substrate-binding domain-containing protein [Bacilli bacterium]|nr:transporter substrate-binding domain-containing protein [Bacilli bacterium]